MSETKFETDLKQYGIKGQTVISLEEFFEEQQQEKFYDRVECFKCHWIGQSFGFTKKKHTAKSTVLRVFCPNCMMLIAYISNEGVDLD